jgi:putative endonuclease
MTKQYNFWVYMLTNWKKTVLYIGVTNNLERRLIEHYQDRGKQDTFTGRTYCYNLVYFEWHQYILNAIDQEKYLKTLLRAKKDLIVTKFNPEWKFLNKEVCGAWPPDKAIVFEKKLGDIDETMIEEFQLIEKDLFPENTPLPIITEGIEPLSPTLNDEIEKFKLATGEIGYVTWTGFENMINVNWTVKEK